jgi:hypothetical protein
MINVSSSSLYRFAKLNPQKGLEAMERGTDTWLWERNTLRLYRVQVPDPTMELAKQINEMIDLYNNVTEFCWPDTWKELVCTFIQSFIPVQL